MKATSSMTTATLKKPTASDPLFHLVSVRKDNGLSTAMTKTPVNRANALVMISKITPLSFRELRLVLA